MKFNECVGDKAKFIDVFYTKVNIVILIKFALKIILIFIEMSLLVTNENF